MRLFEFEEQPQIGDILEIELGEEIVEAIITGFDGDEIIAETDSLSGGTLLVESYGKYWCSTDKKWKERQGPKQTREAADPAQQAAIAIAKKEKVKEEKQRLDPKCWDGYKKQGTKMKGGVRVNNCVPESAEGVAEGKYKCTCHPGDADPDCPVHGLEPMDVGDALDVKKGVAEGFNELDEAEYQGRTVKLGKPMQGDVKKFKVYVRNPKTGKTIKVNFGDPNMRIKKSNPKRRKSFRARHNCSNPGPRTKARYWSCRKW